MNSSKNHLHRMTGLSPGLARLNEAKFQDYVSLPESPEHHLFLSLQFTFLHFSHSGPVIFLNKVFPHLVPFCPCLQNSHLLDVTVMLTCQSHTTRLTPLTYSYGLLTVSYHSKIPISAWVSWLPMSVQPLTYLPQAAYTEHKTWQLFCSLTGHMEYFSHPFT